VEPRGVNGPRPARGGVRVIAACGAPPVWSAGGRATVLSCIGCGRIDTAAQCAGTCGERRLEIVPAVAHERVASRLATERDRAQQLRAFCERLMTCELGESAFRSLRAEARSLVRDPEPWDDEPAQRLTTWACGGCGRVEADAPCVGICTDAPLDVVRASVHDEARAELERWRARVHELAGVARLVAFTTPRDGNWAVHLRALQRVAGDRAAEAQPPKTDRTAEASTAHAVPSSPLERA
jgi:hypothetical protein